jgi:hypothetical protein
VKKLRSGKMNQKRIIATTTALGLVLVLAWGCQNSKPVGPMKYVSLKASVSMKDIAKPSQGEYLELLYRITGPSMNPVSGKVTMGLPEGYLEVGANASAVRPSAEDSVNFTVDVPAGPSRTLAVQVNYMGEISLRNASLTDPNRVVAIGATRFDINPGTQVVDVPVVTEIMCGDCCWDWGSSYDAESFNGIRMAYIGNTDIVNCAHVPNNDAFYSDSCDAKTYFQGGISGGAAAQDLVGPNCGLEPGDVYCIASYDGGHYWMQVGDAGGGDVSIRYRYNSTQPFYAYQENGCGPVDYAGPPE